MSQRLDGEERARGERSEVQTWHVYVTDRKYIDPHSRRQEVDMKEKKSLKRLRPLILLALVAGLAFQFTRLDESKKRFIIHLAKQVPYLPGRYYA